VSLSIKSAKAQYRGDPGLFGDIWKGVKTVGRVATGIVGAVAPGPLGTASKFANRLFGGGKTKVTGTSVSGPVPISATMTRFAGPGPGTSMPAMPGTGRGGITLTDRLRGAGQVMVPGGVETFGCNGADGIPRVPVTSMRPAAVPINQPRPRGYRPNRSSYYTKDGTWHEKGQWWVKSRTVNPLNPKALARAATRVGRFNEGKKKTSHITVRAKKCGKCA